MIKRPTGWIAYCENCWRELSSNEIDECWPQDEDEFIKDLKNVGWCVDEKGEVYCCEECMKEKKEEEMSNERQETISDIVADIRAQNQGLPEDSYALSPLVCDLLSFADRIEAAHNREREATREKSSAVGNAAAMRKALMEASIALSSATHHHLTEDDAKECLAVIESALSKPPRNCDVGTAEEQAKRFNSFCKTHLSGIRGICSPQCPCIECRSMFHCLTKWAQMQYE